VMIACMADLVMIHSEADLEQITLDVGREPTELEPSVRLTAIVTLVTVK
jgi:hypothetical protein